MYAGYVQGRQGENSLGKERRVIRQCVKPNQLRGCFVVIFLPQIAQNTLKFFFAISAFSARTISSMMF